jgi:hypothetical protein
MAVYSIPNTPISLPYYGLDFTLSLFIAQNQSIGILNRVYCPSVAFFLNATVIVVWLVGFESYLGVYYIEASEAKGFRHKR